MGYSLNLRNLSIRQLSAISGILHREPKTVLINDLVRHYGGANRNSLVDAPAIVRQAVMTHFPYDQWGNACAVARGESGWNPTAHCKDCFYRLPDGSYHKVSGPLPEGATIIKEDSRGLFQINVIPHSWALGYNLFDPMQNALVARKVYNSALEATGNGWQPWTAATEMGIRS